MQVDQVHIADLGDRPIIFWRRFNRTQLFGELNPSQRNSSGFLVFVATNSLSSFVELGNALLASGLCVVPRIRLLPVSGRAVLLTSSFSIPCHFEGHFMVVPVVAGN